MTLAIARHNILETADRITAFCRKHGLHPLSIDCGVITQPRVALFRREFELLFIGRRVRTERAGGRVVHRGVRAGMTFECWEGAADERF